MTDIKELTENDLLNASGGGSVPSDHFEGVTRMKCDFCNYGPEWAGDFMNGYVTECPECHNHCFHGAHWVHYE